MRKRTKQVVACIMSGIMVLSMAACSKKPVNTNNTVAPSSEVETTEVPQEEDDSPFAAYTKDEKVEDLGGYEFKIAGYAQGMWDPQEIKSPRDEMVVAIKEDVEKKFNCKIVYENISPGNMFEKAQPEIMSGGKFADLIETTMWAYGPLLGADLVADLNQVETLDLNADWVNKNVVDIATFGDKTYAFGGTMAEHLGASWVVFYNKRIWAELGLPDPYELVRKGEWTWDKLVEYSKLALKDNNGDGVINSEADRWGIIGEMSISIDNVYMSLGGKFYSKDSAGNIVLGTLEGETPQKLNKMYEMYQKDNILFLNKNDKSQELFAEGKALFMPKGASVSDTMKNMEDDFGVLPSPKWDAAQEDYINPVSDNGAVYAIPKSNDNLKEAGIIINALGRRYQAVQDQMLQDYEDTALRSDDDVDMLRNYVVGHGGYDVFHLVKNIDDKFKKPSGSIFDACINNSNIDMVSAMAAFQDSLNIDLSEIFSHLK